MPWVSLRWIFYLVWWSFFWNGDQGRWPCLSQHDPLPPLTIIGYYWKNYQVTAPVPFFLSLETLLCRCEEMSASMQAIYAQTWCSIDVAVCYSLNYVQICQICSETDWTREEFKEKPAAASFQFLSNTFDTSWASALWLKGTYIIGMCLVWYA
jgi:hypothetical protein